MLCSFGHGKKILTHPHILKPYIHVSSHQPDGECLDRVQLQSIGSFREFQELCGNSNLDWAGTETFHTWPVQHTHLTLVLVIG